MYFLRVCCLNETSSISVTGSLSTPDQSRWQETLVSPTNVKELHLLMLKDDNMAFIICTLIAFVSYKILHYSYKVN